MHLCAFFRGMPDNTHGHCFTMLHGLFTHCDAACMVKRTPGSSHVMQRCAVHRNSLTLCHARAEAQYQSLQKLLAEFNAFSARAPNRLLRPAARPHDPGSARRWWRYAASAVKRQLPSRAFNWQQLEKVPPCAWQTCM